MSGGAGPVDVSHLLDEDDLPQRQDEEPSKRRRPMDNFDDSTSVSTEASRGRKGRIGGFFNFGSRSKSHGRKEKKRPRHLELPSRSPSPPRISRDVPLPAKTPTKDDKGEEDRRSISSNSSLRSRPGAAAPPSSASTYSSHGATESNNHYSPERTPLEDRKPVKKGFFSAFSKNNSNKRPPQGRRLPQTTNNRRDVSRSPSPDDFGQRRHDRRSQSMPRQRSTTSLFGFGGPPPQNNRRRGGGPPPGGPNRRPPGPGRGPSPQQGPMSTSGRRTPYDPRDEDMDEMDRSRNAQSLPRRRGGGFGLFGGGPSRGRGGGPPPGRRGPSPGPPRGPSPQQQGGPPPRRGGFGIFGGGPDRRSMQRPPQRPGPGNSRPDGDYPPGSREQGREPEITHGSRTPLNQTAESIDGRPPRQMGRRTGRFKRRNSPEDPLSPNGRQPPPPGSLDTSRASTVVQDLFVENVRKPAPVSRRASTSSSNAGDDNDQSHGDRNNPLRKSSSSLGRTDSYRRSKAQDPLSDPLAMTRRPPRGQFSHSSMPRLNRKSVGALGDLETPAAGSSGDAPRSLGRSKSQTGAAGGKPADDPCKVM